MFRYGIFFPGGWCCFVCPIALSPVLFCYLRNAEKKYPFIFPDIENDFVLSWIFLQADITYNSIVHFSPAL